MTATETILPWLDRLGRSASAQTLRADLAGRWPALVPSRLKRLAIVGAAGEGIRLAGLCAAHGIEVAAVADDDPARRGMAVGTSIVQPVETLGGLDRATPVVIASHRVLKATDRLRAMGFNQCAPFALLQVLDPAAFPPHMFYAGWLEDLFVNRERYAALAPLLADDWSRRVLDANIGYRMTCDPAELRPIVEWDLYGPANLLRYGPDEVYVDGGTFDGDSIRLFMERVGGRFDRIVGFEPDRGTFARLKANFDGRAGVELVNKGLFERTATLRFDDAGTRGSILTEGAGVEIEVTSLDEYLGDARVTFIKMNIEGAELDALRGAAGVLGRWAPKLAISAYHRAGDLWQVPSLVRELQDGYDLYLRQHDGGVIETVLYALPRGTGKEAGAPAAHRPPPVPDMPERYLIDLATKCNLRCPMCPVWGSGDDAAIDQVRGAMDLAASRALLDEMMAAPAMLQPNMYGEPLLAPDLREQIADMKRRGITVALNTNGLTLTDDLARFFVAAGLDSIFFSIDATTPETLLRIRGIDKLEKIEGAVLRMLEARGDADHPRIGVSFTEQDGNRHERDDFVRRWARVVDCVRVGLVFENGAFRDMPDPGPRTPCPALYSTMPIHNDGHVTICCLDGFRQTDMGNVFRDGGIRAVWHGEAFRRVREAHEAGRWDDVPFCKPCNGWAQYAFTEEVADGLLIRRSPQYTYFNSVSRLRNWHGALLGGHPAPPAIEEAGP